MSVPVSSVCPKCGATTYRKVRPRSKVAFGSDRICLSCDTRYAPPTPFWAALLFILAGAFVFLGGASMVAVATWRLVATPERDFPRALVSFAWSIPFVIGGVLSVAHGWRALRHPGS